jgi:hypothetical protein
VLHFIINNSLSNERYASCHASVLKIVSTLSNPSDSGDIDAIALSLNCSTGKINNAKLLVDSIDLWRKKSL